jgi:hypothetical protein
MNEISEKYKNWLVSLESDNFSLFIKTWFAFLSSIQRLHSDTKEDSPDGDKKFINAYAKGYLKKVSLEQVLRANIIRVYELSKPLIMTEYNSFYFSTFYRLNMDYHLEIIDKLNDLNLSFKVTGKDKERRFDIRLRSTNKKFQDIFGFYLNAVIILYDYIKDSSFENWDNFYKLILKKEFVQCQITPCWGGDRLIPSKPIHINGLLFLNV